MKYKIEVFLLLLAIVLLAVSAPVFCYAPTAAGLKLAPQPSENAAYPFRGYAVGFVVLSVVMIAVATVLYLRHSRADVCAPQCQMMST